VPEVFAETRLTVHVPRRPYASRLPGIPTIRPFEALACGTPMSCAPWNDCEGLFRPGEDYLIASDSGQMMHQMERVLTDADTARSLAGHGLERVRARHTCAHRVEELLVICKEIEGRALACGGRNP
jgi:spore maturation protein CgeB